MNGVCGSNLILNFIELRNNILKLVVSWELIILILKCLSINKQIYKWLSLF